MSDQQLAALRAFLVLEPDEAGPPNEQTLEVGGVEGYGELVYAAFVTATRRRFSPTWTVPDVIRFVAAVRAELLEEQVDIDPRTAEVLIRRALGDGIVTVLDEEAGLVHRSFCCAPWWLTQGSMMQSLMRSWLKHVGWLTS